MKRKALAAARDGKARKYNKKRIGLIVNNLQVLHIENKNIHKPMEIPQISATAYPFPFI